MYNLEVHCVFSTNSRIAHDISCRYAKTIDKANIKLTKRFPKRKYTYCKYCGKTAILRSCINDVENFDSYIKLFEDVPVDNLFQLYVKSEAYSNWQGENLIIFCRHDYWKLVPQNDKIILYHNSYLVDSEGNRYFTGEWHPQADGKLYSTKQALKKLSKYNYKDHLKHKCPHNQSKKGT